MAIDSPGKASEWKVENPMNFVDTEEMRRRGNAAANKAEEILGKYLTSIVGGAGGVRQIGQYERLDAEQKYIKRRLAGYENDIDCKTPGIRVYLSDGGKDAFLKACGTNLSIPPLPAPIEVRPGIWEIDLPQGGFELERRGYIIIYVTSGPDTEGVYATEEARAKVVKFTQPPICMHIYTPSSEGGHGDGVLRVEGYNCGALVQNFHRNPHTLEPLPLEEGRT